MVTRRFAPWRLYTSAECASLPGKVLSIGVSPVKHSDSDSVKYMILFDILIFIYTMYYTLLDTFSI